MLEDIPWQSVGAVLPPWGVVLLGFILMMRGDLIPFRNQ